MLPRVDFQTVSYKIIRYSKISLHKTTDRPCAATGHLDAHPMKKAPVLLTGAFSITDGIIDWR